MSSRIIALVATVVVGVSVIMWRVADDRQAQLAGPRGSQLLAAQANQQPDAQKSVKKKKGTGQRKKAGQKKASAQQQQQRAVDGQAEQTAAAPVLSFGDAYDDFPSIAQAADGTLYAAYAAYYDNHDQIRVHKQLDESTWSTRSYVPVAEARPDIWMPQAAVDANNRLWLIWAEQTDRTKTESGNWDLYARSRTGDEWGELVQLTDHPKPDINPHLFVDAQHNIHLVWQAHPENEGTIMYRRYDGQGWSRPLRITSGEDSDWYPQVAVDSHGVAWIVFDSYRSGDYDVYLVAVENDRAGAVIPIATSKYYEAHPSVACTSDGGVWIAWEQGGYQWGKDQGHWLRLENANVGSTLGSARQVRVALYKENQLWAAPGLEQVLTADVSATAMATLAADDDDRLWLRFRQQNRDSRGGNRARRYWTEQVTYLTEAGWSAPQQLPGSTGRISVFSRILPAREGGLWVAYSSDQRNPANYHQPVHDQVLVHKVSEPEPAAGVPQMQRYQDPEPPGGAAPWDVDREAAQVAAARQHRVEVNGQSLRIVRGDLHRHTELSWDVGPANDGSYLDFYRYMIDVASMDFGALTDHQGGGHYAYHWWLTQKSADMYYLPPRFVPLYGYERSVRFPHGHRNVFHSYRGVPVFPFQTLLEQQGVFPGVGTDAVVANDTKLLYEYLHGTDGVAISHTSGTSSMGTDWRDNDPAIEPVVEIYQGARNSYEVVGGPRVHDIAAQPPDAAPGGFQEAGMVWNALAKGYRLGTITSSDHGSTHISYALVYTPDNKRTAILDAIRQRHTYGATDNLIVEVWANETNFMGEEFTTDKRPAIVLRASGTAPIARIDLIRNNQYVYTTSPLTETADVRYVDMEAEAGLNYYYFRLQQEDGEVAWASPVWVNVEDEE